MTKFFKVLKVFGRRLPREKEELEKVKTFNKENPKHSLEMQEKKPSQEIENLFVFLILF